MPYPCLSLLVLAPAATLAAEPHHGAYIDPKHYTSPKSFAGMRYIAEGTGNEQHILKMVGSDDGKTWWTLQGTCSGPQMATLTFDFSPKGGPKELVGAASTLKDGSAQIKWPDGNIWKRIVTPAQSNDDDDDEYAYYYYYYDDEEDKDKTNTYATGSKSHGDLGHAVGSHTPSSRSRLEGAPKTSATPTAPPETSDRVINAWTVIALLVGAVIGVGLRQSCLPAPQKQASGGSGGTSYGRTYQAPSLE